MLGIPCHFREKNNRSACGLVNPRIISSDKKKINCIKCKKTKAFKE